MHNYDSRQSERILEIIRRTYPDMVAFLSPEELPYIDCIHRVGCVHEDKEHGAKDFGFVWAAMFGRLLSSKRLTGHPYEIVPRGLEGVEDGLQQLMSRTNGNEKLVFRQVHLYGDET